MKRTFLFIIAFIMCISAYSSDNFLYLYNTSRTTGEIFKDYPLFIRFGEDVVFYGDSQLSDRLGVRMPSKPVKNDLYIASSKKANTTELLGEDISVEYVNGGFVLFSGEEKDVNTIFSRQDEFFYVEKVEFPMVVFERGSLKEIEIDKGIEKTINSVSADRIKKDLQKLVDYKTRWTFTPIFKDVINDARENFDSIGYKAQILEWKTWKGTGYNVMAVKKGKSERQIIVVAHIDSTSPKKSTLAPGADDNGSGSAGVFEIARVLMDIDTEHTIVFLLAGGEEDGILGTNDYVKKYADRDIVDYVINMDMIGFTKSNPDVIFIETSSRFENFAQEIAAIGETYCDFFSEISLRPFGSDHMPFINNGIPAVLTIEKDWDENKNYHQVTDTYNTIDFNFLERVVKMNTAAVLHFDKYIK